MAHDVDGAEIGMLADALLRVRTREECLAFLDDLLTRGEIRSLAQRLEVARMLRKKVTYHVIAQKTGASTATISRVNRALSYGPGGYERVISRLCAEESDVQP